MTLEEKKARLVELKMKLEQMKQTASVDAERGGLQAAAERMMIEDPTGAFDLLDKSRALDIKEQQAARERGLGSSEEVRRQLRMNAERAAENSRNPDLDKKVRARYLEEEAVYLAESEKDSPSLQAAAIAVGEIRRGNKKVQGPGTEYDPGTVTYDSAVTSLKEKMQKMKYKDEATKYKPTFLEMIANLAEGDQKTLNGLFDAEAAKLANRPGAVKRPSTTSKDISANITAALGAIALYSALSELDPSSVQNRQILWKADQRGFSPEAVNEGDLQAGRSTLNKAISKITGIAPEISLDEAVKARNRAKSRYDKAVGLLRNYSSDNVSDEYFKTVSAVTARNIKDALGAYTWVPLKNKDMEGGSSVLPSPPSSGKVGKATWRKK